MPTGYTHEAIRKKMGLPEFAMLCARAFGACVTMREDDMGAPVPEEFKPSEFCANMLANARKRLAELEAMTQAQREAAHAAWVAEEVAECERSLAKRRATNDYLQSLFTRVAEWQPPTPDHAGLKTFMLQQIDASKEDTAYVSMALARARERTVADWYTAEVEQARSDIEHYADSDSKERERVAGRNKWLADLRASLKG